MRAVQDHDRAREVVKHFSSYDDVVERGSKTKKKRLIHGLQAKSPRNHHRHQSRTFNTSYSLRNINNKKDNKNQQDYREQHTIGQVTSSKRGSVAST